MASEADDGATTEVDEYVRSVEQVSIPPSIRTIVADYEAAGGERDRFLWRWIYDLLPSFTLSSVPGEYARDVRLLKTKLTILVTLLDDVAESDGDVATFRAICRCVQWPDAPTSVPSGADADLVDFAVALWRSIDADLRRAPRHDAHRSLFDYDFRQVCNAMDYSRLLNDDPSIATVGGARRYDSHNMVVFPYSDVDLMHSPDFDRADIAPTRSVLWDLQTMARIGNWLTTWKREVREGDFSSGVVVYALQQGIVSPEELARGDRSTREAVVERIETHRVEALFEAEWRQLDRRVSNRDVDAESVDLSALVAGFEGVMDHHRASEGYK